MTKETWTAKHDEAVMLVAEDKLADVKIAEMLGISKRTLEDWKKEELFLERLDVVITEFRNVLLRHGIARHDRRLARLNKTWEALQTIIEEREGEVDAPGGDTGLIIMQEKGVGGGDNFRLIKEYGLDAAILAELRALEMQAAKECGQWVDKKQTDLTTGGKPLPAGPDLRNLSAERLAQLEEILMEAEEKGIEDAGTADPASGESREVPA